MKLHCSNFTHCHIRYTTLREYYLEFHGEPLLSNFWLWACETLMGAGGESVFVYWGGGDDQASGQQKLKGKMGSH